MEPPQGTGWGNALLLWQPFPDEVPDFFAPLGAADADMLPLLSISPQQTEVPLLERALAEWAPLMFLRCQDR